MQLGDKILSSAVDEVFSSFVDARATIVRMLGLTRRERPLRFRDTFDMEEESAVLALLEVSELGVAPRVDTTKRT